MIYSGEIIGAAIVAVPLLFLAWGFLWRRHRPVFWFAVDIARIVVPNLVRA
jgi:hypothetical protein